MITRLRLGHLSGSETARLSEIVDLWSNISRSTAPINPKATARAVNNLYNWYGLPIPKIVWCNSPWQIAEMYMKSNLRPDAGESNLDLRHSVDSDQDAEADENENQGAWRRFLLRLSLTAQNQFRTGSEQVMRRFLPVRNCRLNSVFYGTRRPLLAPILRPSIDRNIVTFAPSCVIDVGMSGRNTLRHTAAAFGGRSGLQPRAHMLSQWPSYVLDTFVDSATRASVESFIVSNRSSFSRDWVFADYHRHLSKHAQSSRFSEASSLILDLIWFSSWSSDWIPMYAFLVEYGFFTREETTELNLWLELARNGSAYSFFEGICLVSDRPRALSCDERGRLHHPSSAALSFADDRDLYSWLGVTCPRDIIEEPEKITIARIESEHNAEIKRILIDRFGAERYLVDSKNAKIHEDEFGILYMKHLGALEPIAMVRVRNSTPESDGTYKEYFLRVPPTVTTAREAVAWTFDLDSLEYNPCVET